MQTLFYRLVKSKVNENTEVKVVTLIEENNKITMYPGVQLHTRISIPKDKTNREQERIEHLKRAVLNAFEKPAIEVTEELFKKGGDLTNLCFGGTL